MRLISYITDLIKSLTDFLFPKSQEVLELESLSPEKLLSLLPASTLVEENTLAVFDYSHTVVKEIVWEIKYNGNRILADKIGEILYDVILSELEDRNVFEKTAHRVALLPVPISDKRRFERGWNQSELIVSAIKERDAGNRFKYLPRQLAKIRHTESQTKTGSKSERKENLKDSMKVLNPPSLSDRYVVLVDDVTTTGSTFAEAKRALKDAGVKKIISVAVAH